MAAADLLSMLPLHQQTFDQDSEMDNFFDFNQVAPRSNQSQSQPQPPPNFNSALTAADDFDTQTFAGPSHQYDLFRQQTGIPVGDMSHLNAQTDPFLDNSMDSWSFDLDGMTDFGSSATTSMLARSGLSTIAETHDAAEEEQVSNVGRLWPGMHQQQAQQRAAQAKAQALALRQARANMAQQELVTPVERPMPLLAPQPAPVQLRQQSIAPSINDDDFPISNGFMPSSSRPSVSGSKKEEDEMDEDERLLASEEGKKLSSKERRQLRNKVSARAFRSRRKEYITQLEGELNTKVQECDTLKANNVQLAKDNARYVDLLNFLIKQPSFAPTLEELNRNPSMLGSQGLSLLPPTSAAGQSFRPSNVNQSPAEAPMPDGAMFNGMPFNFQ